jgi:hypothetical protein
VIQSLFMAMGGTPPDEAEIDAYCGRLADLVAAGGRIDLVQVYTVSRPPADRSVSALPIDRLESIAGRVRALGLTAEVFGP